MNSFKLINIKLLINNPNLKVNTIGRRQINPNFINIKPNKNTLNLNTLKITN